MSDNSDVEGLEIDELNINEIVFDKVKFENNKEDNKLKTKFIKGLACYDITFDYFVKNYRYYGGDGRNSISHLRYFNIKTGRDVECREKTNIEYSKNCICSHEIKENCYVRDDITGRILVVGNCCIKKFCENPTRTCDICGASHKSYKNNLCKTCNKKDQLQKGLIKVCISCNKEHKASGDLCGKCNRRQKEIDRRQKEIDDEIDRRQKEIDYEEREKQKEIADEIKYKQVINQIIKIRFENRFKNAVISDCINCKRRIINKRGVCCWCDRWLEDYKNRLEYKNTQRKLIRRIIDADENYPPPLKQELFERVSKTYKDIEAFLEIHKSNFYKNIMFLESNTGDKNYAIDYTKTIFKKYINDGIIEDIYFDNLKGFYIYNEIKDILNNQFIIKFSRDLTDAEIKRIGNACCKVFKTNQLRYINSYKRCISFNYYPKN